MIDARYPCRPRVVPSGRTISLPASRISLALLVLLGTWTLGNGAVRISEFMAQNDGGFRDIDGETPDWIELQNDSASPVNLAGWHFTDSSTNLTRWTFPATSLPPGGYLIVFASGKDRAAEGAELHTDFQLDGAGGYLALVQPDGVTVAQAINYPAQRANVSFGAARAVVSTPVMNSDVAGRVFVPSNGALGLNWTTRLFDDSTWAASNAPVGFNVIGVGTPILSIDFNERAVEEAVNTQPSFSSFVINSNTSSTAVQLVPTTRTFGGIAVTVSNTAPLGYDDRARTTPADGGAFTEGRLLRDFIFSREVSGTGGLDVTINGLEPNRAYRLTIWSFDSGSTGNRRSDWYVNGGLATNGYTFGGQTLPTSNEQYRFNVEASADASGTILLSGRRNPTSFNIGGTADLGVFLNALQISSVSSGSAQTGLASLMLSNTASAYLRFPFFIDDLVTVSAMKLNVRYDDGFVAYLNGEPVASRNAPGSPAWNSTATGSHSASPPEEITIVPPPGLLASGVNVLAIHGLNVSNTDPDFLIAPELTVEAITELGGRYFQPATPGADNGTGYLGLVADTKFSVNRGFYEAPFQLSLICATLGAEIRYTTNGSPPALTNGYVFSAPITINRQSFIRAAAFFPNYIPSDIDTHSYIFLRDVLRQSNNIPNYPTIWQGSYPADYAIDPTLVNHPFYGPTLSNDLRSIPVLSIVTEHDGLWGAVRGIYNHATDAHDLDAGRDWERAASAELILPDGPNGATAFAVNCAIRMHGNASRDNARTPKHNVRLRFDGEYGPSKLRYDWFPGNVEEFDNIILRADGFVDAWPSRYSDTTAYVDAITGLSWRGQRYRPETATYLRDVFAKESQRDMGWTGSRSGWVHLYLNGFYWGLYNPIERLDASFMAEHLGGWDSDWDVIVGPDTGTAAIAADGNLNDWSALMAQLSAGVTSEPAYQSISALVDVDNVIDYFLLHFFIEAEDWPHHNWYAAHRRANSTNGVPATKWQIFTWDQEVSLDRNVRRDRTSVGNADTPAYIYSQLRAWPEFRVRFGDRVQKHLFNDGALTPSNNVARFADLAAAITNAINGESARWGDAREFAIGSNPATGVTFTRDEWWVPELNKLWTNFFPRLTADNVARLRAASLYPSTGAPEFNQFGGGIPAGFGLVITHTNSSGVIYFTTDGSDPRTYGTGTVAPGAQAYSTPVVLNATTQVRARVLRAGVWSALVEAAFFPPQDLSKLSLTEIMYNPPAIGQTDGDSYEFVELKNVGTNTLNLSGLSFSGINFTFTNGTMLAPGQFCVLAANPASFATKYPGITVNGSFSGQLANSGESLRLSHPLGTTVFSVTYDDEVPWPVTGDNHGFSLVPRNPGVTQAPDNGTDWRASANPGGSPGADDPTPIVPAIIINELLTATVPPDLDRIELFNPTASSVNVGGWFLTDDHSAPAKFRIPDNTIIPAGGFVVFTEAQFNSVPGSPTSFSLSSQGESVYLFSADADGNLTGYSHGVAFDAAPPGVSFGRYMNSAGEEQFPAQTALSLMNQNSGPLIGPVVISEIHYNPAVGSDEFVELENLTASLVELFDAVHPTNTWRMNGLGFDFPEGITLPPNGRVLIVATNPTAFRAKYEVPAEVIVLGPFSGGLQDSGERLKLQRPSTPDTNGFAYITVDEVRYNDRAPWPPAADGSGPSLQRRVVGAYGNDPINWDAAAPTPGRSLDNADSDGDGLPDSWEMINGTDRFAADADADPDSDSSTNLEEYLAGTDPQSASSRLELQVTSISPELTQLQFLALANRTYTVLYKNSLQSPTWSKLRDIASTTADRVEIIDDASPVTSQRFYRLVTPAQP